MNKVSDLPKNKKKKYFLNEDRKTVAFELLNIDRKRHKIPNANVPGRDFIFNPKTGETTEIVYQTESFMNPITGQTEQRPKSIWFDNGLIICNLSQRRGREMYEYLCMSNYNASNPYRDTNVRPIFEMVDDVVKAKEKLASEEQIVKAKSYVFDMNTEEMRRMADWLDITDNRSEIDSSKEPAVIQTELLKYAHHQPSKIQDAREIIEERGEYISTVIRCLRHQIILKNTNLQRWVWSDSKSIIFGYDVDLSHSQNVLRLARWLEKGENSGQALEQMQEKLKSFEAEYKV